MGRPRTFDEEAVLEAAFEVFWTKGYEATSTRELTARTGLTPSSLYGAFHDKRTLFRRALDRYLDESLRPRIARHEAWPSPAEAVGMYLQETIEKSLLDNRGCLLVNSALEAGPSDPEIGAMIAGELLTIRDFFAGRLQAAQQSGDWRATIPIADAAKLLLTTVLGIRVLARVKPDRDLLAGSARPVLALLGLPALPSERT